jgi:hypothetical protein
MRHALYLIHVIKMYPPLPLDEGIERELERIKKKAAESLP